MPILVRTSPGAAWSEPSESGYDNEAALQQILHEHPSLIPGVSDRAVACREFQSGVGPADVVILSDEGELTLVECKLAANPQVRREVIGQVLDYASRIWRMDVDAFEQTWKRAEKNERSPFEQLNDDSGRIRAALQDNLTAGRFNLVLAVDDLNFDVKRIVEFLNAVTMPTTSVIVVEFTRARESGVEILIPTSYGSELAEVKKRQPGAARRTWKVEDFLRWCDEFDSPGALVVSEFLRALSAAGFEIQGGSAATPSLNCGITSRVLGRKWPVALYTNPTRGALIEIRFTDFENSLAAQEALANKVEAITAIPIPVEEVRASGFHKRPNVPARQFSESQVRELAAAVSSALEC
ncbi:hypothetical protein [Leifsonia xyli]|uniref:hypothetical protein n=1 Tax=Leifsonia xyli TaxID=1575 RepID=UPI003D666AE9